MTGLVTKSTGASYMVTMADNSVLECHIKGNFRIRGIRTTNPVAVGDHVEVEQQADGTVWITAIEPRSNYIIRRSTNLSKEAHILASNLDQVALLVTLNHPVTSTTFIDRFLATAEAYRVSAVLVFNKMDLLDSYEQAHLNELTDLYQGLGYRCLTLSAKNLSEEQEHSLQELLQDRVTLLSGNSGVGKSTLLNTLFGREMTRTGRISEAHDKGMHTTTFSEMYNLPYGGWLIDTPGIKGFGSVEMQATEVSHYFREIFALSRQCRYDDCLHTEQCPHCAVYEGVVRGDIALSRYESYLSLLGDCSESKYR